MEDSESAQTGKDVPLNNAADTRPTDTRRPASADDVLSTGRSSTDSVHEGNARGESFQLPKSRDGSLEEAASKPTERSRSDSASAKTAALPMGAQTPESLLDESQKQSNRDDLLRPVSAAENEGPSYELGRRVSARVGSQSRQRQPTDEVVEALVSSDAYQSVPPELGSLWTELVFVLVCSCGQLLFSFLLGSITVTQTVLVEALGISYSQTPWLVGSFLLANGLSVVISGSLADLAPPRMLMVGAFSWLAAWNLIGSFSFTPSRKILFFITRAMQGLAVGVIVSAAMSILGRIYKPGTRKTRVFSFMAGGAPFGFWLGAIQGGALSAHLPWIFGSDAILCALCTVAAFFTIPPLQPAKDTAMSDAPSMRNFDYTGSLLAVLGCACLIFGLTQGTAANWSPYTYVLVICGILIMILFYFIEGYVSRPLIPKRLWRIPGFGPCVLSYFLGFGSYIAWQYYAVAFFLNVQRASPLKVALYLTPNVICGVLATWIVSRTLHLVPGNVILTASMVAYALGPVFFLPQTPNTTYWALSMPGIALVTFGPDLSFAAISVFVTTEVPRSSQGSAGSLLITTQNLSAAVMTAIAGTIGVRVESGPTGEIGLEGLRAVWWFGFGLALSAALITALFVRIPKSEEKAHAM